MKRIKRLCIIILILPVMLLQGCWLANMPVYVPPHVPSVPVIDEPPAPVDIAPPETSRSHGKFTLRYEPANSLNPILALNRDNISITSLMYESLFILDNFLRPQPILCESWETEDNITYTFTIYPDIAMHDGSNLTADDVAYSLRQAKLRGRHKEKLQKISTVSSDGGLTVTVTLESANARLIRLLDIPIIKADTIDDDVPPGTGPYIFPNPDNLMLTRFVRHRDFSEMPLPAIYLLVCNDNELTELFDGGEISLLWDDPAGSFEIRINRDFEPRYYSTTALQFLGFNADPAYGSVLRNSDIRRAIGCVIDREYIVDEIMNKRPGQTIAAPVAISPVFDMYNSEWAVRTIDPLYEMAALLERSGISDSDFDGYLEIHDGAGVRDFSLVFLVNIENPQKVAATEYIAEGLRQVGFDIEVRALAWAEFQKALRDGNFDIYYGEVQIGADFDFSPLLLPGDLNYGKTANTAYAGIIRDFLAAETQDEVNAAGKVLCDDIRINAPFVPILYKRHAIYTPLGVVSDAESPFGEITGVSPTQSGVFNYFNEWVINLEMLT